MYQGENTVYYTPVEAYALAADNGGIISGGRGEGAVTTEGASFFWVYDPDQPDASGFTGVGWFEQNGPISQTGYSLDAILEGFANGTRTDLTDLFTAWQSYCNEHEGTVTAFVSTLVLAGGSGCYDIG